MRSPWQVTKSVWYALFMREALARIMGDRLGAFWMLAEPIAFLMMWVAIRYFVLGRSRDVIGADYIPWLLVGMVGFFVFRAGLKRTMGAVAANQGLFAYRQVKPIDPVLVRAGLEGLLQTIIFIILLTGAALLDYPIVPADPLSAIFFWVSLWLLGLGAGLVVSVMVSLFPESEQVVSIMMFPMFILSGVILPVQNLPFWLQEILLYNPVLHGLELLRSSFFATYKSLSGVDWVYLWLWTLSLIAWGLALHVRYASHLKAR